MSVLLILLSVVGCFCFFVVTYLVRQYIIWLLSPLRQLPGPKNRGSILGNFVEIRKEPYLQPHKRWWKEAAAQIGTNKMEDVSLIHYNMTFWKSSVLILDKDIVRTILSSPYGKEPLRFRKFTRLLSDILGDGLVTLEGTDWNRHRRILQPAFNTSFLRQTLNEAVPSKVNRFLQCWERATAANPQVEIDVASHLSALTLDVIGDVAFSHDFNGIDAVQDWANTIASAAKETSSNGKANGNHNDDKNKQTTAEELDQLSDPFVLAMLKALNFNLISALLAICGMINFNRYINPPLRKNRQFLDQAVDRVVADARKDNTKRKSLLHLMLQAKDDGDGGEHPNEGSTATTKASSMLSNEELRDEVKTFMIAGHETTSTWLYWAFYALAKYPDVQTRVYEDIVKHAPKGAGSSMLLEHVEKMDYMNAFLQEVLRLYPPAGLLTRVNVHEERFNGVVIPAGTRLSFGPHLMHRHPKFWDQPEEFQPERWLNVSEQEWERRRFVFIPFSAGGRGCIGQHFATMEAKLLLAPMVQAFRIAIAPSQRSTEFQFTSTATLKSKPMVKISLKKR